MLLKPPDDKTPAIAEIERLLSISSGRTKGAVLDELKRMRLGIRGEAESCYEIDFHFKNSLNKIVIHDLRLEVNGRVAQIDHLVLDRLMNIYVLETKFFSSALSFNNRGEFSAIYGDYEFGIASPIEQNRRHVEVLKDALATIKLPTRLGRTLNPTLHPLVIVSRNAQIIRPQKEVFDSSSILKADQLFSLITKCDEDAGVAALAKVVSSDTVKNIGAQLVALHKPILIDYASKFGLSPDTVAAPESPGQNRRDESPGPAGYYCSNCPEGVDLAVARFCWGNKHRFGGKVYCRKCQVQRT